MRLPQIMAMPEDFRSCRGDRATIGKTSASIHSRSCAQPPLRYVIFSSFNCRAGAAGWNWSDRGDCAAGLITGTRCRSRSGAIVDQQFCRDGLSRSRAGIVCSAVAPECRHRIQNWGRARAHPRTSCRLLDYMDEASSGYYRPASRVQTERRRRQTARTRLDGRVTVSEVQIFSFLKLDFDQNILQESGRAIDNDACRRPDRRWSVQRAYDHSRR